MGKNKKPFIDKKKSSTYHLLHRSQRDVAGDVLQEGDVAAMDMVLWPSPENKAATDHAVLGGESSKRLSEWRERLSQAGLLDEASSQHERYLKPITGSGTFLDAFGRVGNGLNDPRTTDHFDEEAALLEVQRQFDSIPLTADCMDEDIAQALFGDFDEGEFEELNDDFVLEAAKEPELDEGEEAFDFDAHIQGLMEKARLERSQQSATPHGHDWGNRDNAFFSKLRPLHERRNEDDIDGDSILNDDGMTLTTTPGVVSALSPEEERALCEKFEATLAEYDSDEMGDCPEEEIHGSRPLEGDAQLEAALDDFLLEKEDEIFMQGTRHSAEAKRTGGSGFSALLGKHMVHASGIDAAEGMDNPAAPDEDDHALLLEQQQQLRLPPRAPPPEDVLIDGQSYYSQRIRNNFDCESILSTYSNLDNNPVTIESQRRRRKKKDSSSASIAEEPVQQIRLSQKTGLPLGVLPAHTNSNDDDDDDGFDDTLVSINRGEARNKTETAEDKKLRKALVKQERQMARMQKKVLRDVFREEFEKRTIDVVADSVAGKTVFRYS